MMCVREVLRCGGASLPPPPSNALRHSNCLPPAFLPHVLHSSSFCPAQVLYLDVDFLPSALAHRRIAAYFSRRDKEGDRSGRAGERQDGEGEGEGEGERVGKGGSKGEGEGGRGGGGAGEARRGEGGEDGRRLLVLPCFWASDRNSWPPPPEFTHDPRTARLAVTFLPGEEIRCERGRSGESRGGRQTARVGGGVGGGRWGMGVADCSDVVTFPRPCTGFPQAFF